MPFALGAGMIAHLLFECFVFTLPTPPTLSGAILEKQQRLTVLERRLEENPPAVPGPYKAMMIGGFSVSGLSAMAYPVAWIAAKACGATPYSTPKSCSSRGDEAQTLGILTLAGLGVGFIGTFLGLSARANAEYDASLLRSETKALERDIDKHQKLLHQQLMRQQ